MGFFDYWNENSEQLKALNEKAKAERVAQSLKTKGSDQKDWWGDPTGLSDQADRDKLGSQEEEKKEERIAKIAEINSKTGSLLGQMSISYVGGFDPKYKSDADRSSSLGTLYCYQKIIYYGKRNNSFAILSNNIVSFEIRGQQQTSSRLSVTRMVALGIFSLAAPKRNTAKDTSIIIGLKDGRQILFHTTASTEFEVHSKLANAISYYHSLQAAQTSQQMASSQTIPTDSAAEIMKYATLRKRGVITEVEFQAKKKQLLGQ